MSAARALAELLLATALLAAAPAEAAERTWTAADLWAAATTEALALAPDGKSLTLARGQLVEDDGPAAGYSYRPNEEKLAAGTVLRKQLPLDDPRADGAWLLIGAARAQLEIQVNGQPLPLVPVGGRGGAYWSVFALPPERLRTGLNEFRFSGGGTVWIARDDEYVAGSRTRPAHPNRSAKSRDGGQTWDERRLGTGDNVDGEYYVRLFLDQYLPAGAVELPVVDAVTLADDLLMPPAGILPELRWNLQTETPPETSLAVEARAGPLLSPTGGGWSEWVALPGSGRAGVAGGAWRPRGRFVQFRLRLATADPRQTPRLRSLRLEAPAGRPASWSDALRIVEAQAPARVASSIPFEYEPFDQPALVQLRREQRLDEVVAGASTEWERIARLAAWSARQWKKGHLGQAYPAWDARQILAPAADGTPVGGFCQQFNLVFLQACQSFGLHGRCLSLGPGGEPRLKGGGHEVVEIWSNEWRKWAYVDGNEAWCFQDAETNAPLSLVELRDRQRAFLAGRSGPETRLVRLAEGGRAWQDLGSWPPFEELRLIPRNNFLSQQTPLPLNQGMRGWFWTGHHALDDDGSAAWLYGHRVRQRRNLEWTLNQTAIRLEATAAPNVLRLHLDHDMPGFRAHRARIGARPEQEIASGFEWRLAAGENRLEVRAENLAGVQGPAAQVRLLVP